MTREDQFVGQLEQYLDEFEGITPLPDAIRSAVRAELPKTKQAGPNMGLARFSGMSNAFKVGIAAAVIGVAALIGYSLYSTVGLPNPTETPRPSNAGGQALPTELIHPFLGQPRTILGVLSGDRAILLLTDGTGEFADGNTDNRFRSAASVVGGDTIKFITTTNSTECDRNAVGTYPYHLSPGGSILTIAPGEDDCAGRSDAFVGDWQRSACKDPGNNCLGEIEAGTYASQYIDPRLGDTWRARFGALLYTVPDGWANYADWPDRYGLTTATEYATVLSEDCFGCSGVPKTLAVYASPVATATDCTHVPAEGVGGSPDDLVAFLSDNPGLTVGTPEATTVDGHQATAVDIEAHSEGPGVCHADGFTWVPAFHREDGYEVTFNPDDAWHLILVDMGGNTVAIVADADPASLEDWKAQTAPIIDSFQFPPPGDR